MTRNALRNSFSAVQNSAVGANNNWFGGAVIELVMSYEVNAVRLVL